jgi:hypothetical protein
MISEDGYAIYTENEVRYKLNYAYYLHFINILNHYIKFIIFGTGNQYIIYTLLHN